MVLKMPLSQSISESGRCRCLRDVNS